MKSAQYHPCEVGENNYLHMGKARQTKWSAQDDKEVRSKWSKALSSDRRANLPLHDHQPINPLS